MDTYLLIKALHLISIVAWFAGLFYLPRLYVYHCQAHGDEAKAMLATMERKLLRYIMNPAMIATWAFGITLLVMNPAWMQGGWLHAKLTLVVLLSIYHMSLARYRRQLADGRCTKSETFFRIYNEVPTVVLIAVVLLAVLKPF